MQIAIRRRSIIAGLTATIAGVRGAAQAADTVRLTFIHFNDVYRHGPAEQYGGIAELATLIETERARAQGPVFQTFGGDVLSPSIASSVTHGAHMIALLNALGNDIAVLGNHEFDFGSDNAAKQIAASRFPWLGANVLGPDGKPFGGAIATTMRAAGGLKIGFVGILTKLTAILSPQADGVTFADEEAALRAGAAELRRQGADVIVALTHQDLRDDERMAREIAEIDLILGGHDHDPTQMRDTGAPVLKSASDGRWLAVVELAVTRPDAAKKIRAGIHSVGWKLIPNVDIPPSPRIAPFIAEIDANLSEILAQPIATLTAPLDTRAAALRSGEAAFGNLVADALRAHFNADAALINGGALRGDREYKPGTVLTRRDLMTEMPFGNAVVEVEATGAMLRAALEYGVSAEEDKAGRYPQVSGLRFTYAAAAPAGQRVREVWIGDRPLDPERAYRLAITDYLAAGGDGYDVLKTAKTLVNASGGPLLVNVVTESAQKTPALAVSREGRSRAV